MENNNEYQRKSDVSIARVEEICNGIKYDIKMMRVTQKEDIAEIKNTHRDMWEKINKNTIQIEIMKTESKNQARNMSMLISGIATVILFLVDFLKFKLWGKN